MFCLAAVFISLTPKHLNLKQRFGCVTWLLTSYTVGGIDMCYWQQRLTHMGSILGFPQDELSKRQSLRWLFVILAEANWRSSRYRSLVNFSFIPFSRVKMQLPWPIGSQNPQLCQILEQHKSYLIQSGVKHSQLLCQYFAQWTTLWHCNIISDNSVRTK